MKHIKQLIFKNQLLKSPLGTQQPCCLGHVKPFTKPSTSDISKPESCKAPSSNPTSVPATPPTKYT